MYKDFYGEDREWALWRIGGGRSGSGGGGAREGYGKGKSG